MAAPAAAKIEILTTVAAVRGWRQRRFAEGTQVGFVPTMGALHDGHLELMRQSLSNTDETICSIFVNPAQFAPTEDLSKYPRTLEADLQKLERLEADGKRVSALFLPGVHDLYPDGIEQDVAKQRGTFVDVVGFSQEMEGSSRPTFFRGVTTVVVKLFNIVQPDETFFGQKDIQQCLILRRMLSDLHIPHPPSPLHLRIVPTVRDIDDVALSSRNSYLTPAERRYAPALITALRAAQDLVRSSVNAQRSVNSADVVTIALTAMQDFINSITAEQANEKPAMRNDYIKINDPITLLPLISVSPFQPAVISGAVWINGIRLIDNLLVNIIP